MRRFKLILAAFGLVLSWQAAAQNAAEKPVRIRGEIVSFAGDVLTIKRTGINDTVKINVKPDLGVGALKKIRLKDIKPGAYIGTAATTGPDGKLTAIEVLVFPEAGRGTGEGHYDWDLAPNTTMTNANVDAVVAGKKGRELKLSYKGGSNDVTVPVGAPIVTFIDASRSDLVVGKHVFIVAAPVDPTTFSALRIVVEKDGVAPPM